MRSPSGYRLVRLARIPHRLSSRSGGEGCGCKACDRSTSSGQAEARVEEVYPERPFAKGRLVPRSPAVRGEGWTERNAADAVLSADAADSR
jgi:hypothetical protein